MIIKAMAKADPDCMKTAFEQRRLGAWLRENCTKINPMQINITGKIFDGIKTELQLIEDDNPEIIGF
jgi:hypothetical protein